MILYRVDFASENLNDPLYSAKSFKEQGSSKYCWAKDTAIFLRKSDSSRVMRHNTVQDLQELRHSEAAEQLATKLPLIAPKAKQ